LADTTYLPCGDGSALDVDRLEEYIKPNTKLMIMSHASNVTGAILPYEKCAEIARKHGILFVLDAAQTAGLIDIDFDNSDIDALVFTGHKSLMGPPGTGGVILKPRAAKLLGASVTGGTGSKSHLLEHPDFLPDKFQPGTPNTLGILGLGASVEYILEIGVKNIFEHEMRLTLSFIDAIKQEGVRIYGPAQARVPIVSFNIDGVDNALLEQILHRKFGISTRSGLHCSPLAHKSIGTYPSGALRVSAGFFNTAEEIEYSVEAINKIIKHRKELSEWI
jgi:selenocysteine lyase/cysteine desulfurase